MTSPPPDEALHFRGETLTPESPRPLHAAEPSNIPVLENQIDPVFNDTSTYETTESSLEIGNHMHHHRDAGQPNWNDFYPQPSFQATGSPPEGDADGQQLSDQSASPPREASPSTAWNAHNASSLEDSDQHRQVIPEAMTVPSDTFRTASEAADTSPKSQGFPGRDEVRTRSQGKDDKVSNSDDSGIDFENLLDNLSRGSATTTSVPALSHVPQAISDAESSHAVSGLSSRPEQPSTGSDYSPVDEPGADDQFPLNASDTTAQDLNGPSIYAPDQETPSSWAPADTSGAWSAAVASSSGAGSRGGNRKRSRADKQSGRKPKSDEDTPWGPEVQRKYDEFLHDERIYVTEGLWDRFPYGSRLFVGQHICSLPLHRISLGVNISDSSRSFLQAIYPLKGSLSVTYFTYSTNTENWRRYRLSRRMASFNSLKLVLVNKLSQQSREFL